MIYNKGVDSIKSMLQWSEALSLKPKARHAHQPCPVCQSAPTALYCLLTFSFALKPERSANEPQRTGPIVGLKFSHWCNQSLVFWHVTLESSGMFGMQPAGRQASYAAIIPPNPESHFALQSSGTLRHVTWHAVTNVFEDPAASIFMLPAVQEKWPSYTLNRQAATPPET
jgi:hypothetical protein